MDVVERVLNAEVCDVMFEWCLVRYSPELDCRFDLDVLLQVKGEVTLLAR